MRSIEITTTDCTFRKEGKTLVFANPEIGGGFPDTVRVTSTHTGRTVDFVRDTEAAIAAEFWDGEECHYIPASPLRNVEKLVIHWTQ
jgi:hypothetical protein